MPYLQHPARRELVEQSRAQRESGREHTAAAARARAVVRGQLVAPRGEE